jgi:quercetin dioxygenase-like cupin family protein
MTRECIDLQSEIDALLADGYRLEMIVPADAPRLARLSRDNEILELCIAANTRSEIRNPQSKGRAGMEYRDLIPDRLGGRVIASHIRLTKGGEVPDYVHYHKIRFQMIYCKAGWIRVVYEDQGPPFVMNAGDCVLQPPGIRHRVLESSAGAEVIEVSAPAEHETWVEHELQLPTAEVKPDRIFEGQRFVLHRGGRTKLSDVCTITETDIERATDGLASVRVVKLAPDAMHSPEPIGGFAFLYVLSGSIRTNDSNRTLHADEHIVFPDHSDKSTITACEDAEILEVRLREI